jgi:hypothetical protein
MQGGDGAIHGSGAEAAVLSTISEDELLDACGDNSREKQVPVCNKLQSVAASISTEIQIVPISVKQRM